MATTTGKIKAALVGVTLALGAALPASAQTVEDPGSIDLQTASDLLHLVMNSDRTVYTRMIVNRLQNEEGVIKASEHFMDDKALVLPAQMFRFGSEMVADETDAFSYSLLSLWPINKQNAPTTPMEQEGLEYVAENIGENYYGIEELGGVEYFTAVYADVAVAPACYTCHNDHKDSPRTDFEAGDVMGGVVIRIPLDG